MSRRNHHTVRLAGLLAVCLLVPATASAQEINFTGSIQLDYATPLQRKGNNTILPGLTTEVAFKIDADIGDSLSFSGKVCYGCHGFEVDRAYLEITPSEALGLDEEWVNFQIGRMPLPFGEFNTRHDPANHKTSSKPLPYMMGHMARYTAGEYNLGVLPIPFVDNAGVFFGTMWPTDFLQVSYQAYVAGGAKGTNDFNFKAMRAPYYVDNNRDVARGGRLVLSLVDPPFLQGLLHEFTVGASIMNGRYDPAGELEYTAWGAELTARIWLLKIRGEYVIRRTDLDPNASGYPFQLIDPFFTKVGWYAEVEHPLFDMFEVVYRFDGLDRLGTPLPNSTLGSTEARILRYTQGINVIPFSGVKIKLNYEYWWFSEYTDMHLGHLSVVGSF